MLYGKVGDHCYLALCTFNFFPLVDLVEMHQFAEQNDGYRYLITVVDVFSKFAFVKPLMRKSAAHVLSAFQDILASTRRRPLTIHTDRGYVAIPLTRRTLYPAHSRRTEFTNKEFQAYLKKEKIGYFNSYDSVTKSACVERFNRYYPALSSRYLIQLAPSTLKNRMYKFFTAKSTKRYLEALPKLVKSYNLAHHRSIGMPPASVTEKNQDEVRQKLYGGRVIRKEKPLAIGTPVVISVQKHVFEPGKKSVS